MKEVEIVKYELGGIKNPCLKIIGTYKQNLNLVLYGDTEKLNFELDENKKMKEFVLTALVKSKKELRLINDGKEVFFLKNKFYKRFLHKLKSCFHLKYYHLYKNNNIGIANIIIDGVIHPKLTLVGKFKVKNEKIKIQSNNDELEYSIIPTPDKNDFYYIVNLTSKNKKIEVFYKNDLIVVIKNRFILRFLNKIYNLLKKILKKIYHIFYVLYRGIRAAWKQYHFIIPPRLWKKYWIDLKNKMHSVDNNLFYNMDNKKDYNKWLEFNETSEEVKSLKYNPLISLLIPVYNIEPIYLKECIESILQQTYRNFEICLVDDASTNKETIETLKEYEKNKYIKIKYRKKNGHISNATNDALKLATGEFVGLIDNDDLLSKNALYEVVKVLNEDKKIDFIYSDEDKLDEFGVRCFPHFKPDFSPDTLMSLNYICHFSVMRKSLVKKVGGFEIGLEGAQDHDLFLKMSDVTNKFYHIPKILYHWRMIEGSTAATLSNKSYAQDKGKIAIENALKRRNLKGKVLKDVSGYYLVKYNVKKNPLISIIIPTRDYSNILEKCLSSLYEKTTYKNFEVIVVNNNSQEEKTFQLFKKYKENYQNFRVIDANMEFNYSKINNMAVEKAKGEYIVLLNNDTEIITPDWLEIMVGYASLNHIGTVGVKLLYPDNTVQHGGVILGLGGVASHAYIGASRNEYGAYGRLRVPYNYSAVTAACLMVKREKFLNVNGLEEKLKVAYNDIDFNIKLLEKGFYNIFLPQVELYHHESKSRGYDTTTEKYERFLKESDFMNKKWKDILDNDKFYNINYSKKGWFVLDRIRKEMKLK